MSCSGAITHVRHWSILLFTIILKDSQVIKNRLSEMTCQYFLFFVFLNNISTSPIVHRIKATCHQQHRLLCTNAKKKPTTYTKQANGSTVCVLSHTAGSMPVRHVQRYGDVSSPNDIANVPRIWRMCDPQVRRASAPYHKVSLVFQSRPCSSFFLSAVGALL